MRKTGWLAGLFLVLFLMVPAPVKAEKELVVDQAELFDEVQEQEIREKAGEMSESWKQDYVVVTVREATRKTSEEYADDYYDSHDYSENGALFLIDLYNNNVWISTSGSMIRFLTDDRIQSVIDAGYGNLKIQQYGDGILQMLDQTERYMNAGIPDGQYNYNPETGEVSRYYSITWVEALVALGLALGGVIIFVVSLHSSYKLKKQQYFYPFQKLGGVRLEQKEDQFINETVTKRTISSSNSSGGGGGGRSSVHTSSSGSSHGGGGRSL